MYPKYLVIIILLVSCCPFSYSDTIVNCEDFCDLMQQVDKLHPPYSNKQKDITKKYKGRDDLRREWLSTKDKLALYKSDSICIVITEGDDCIVGDFVEYVCNDSVHYNMYFGIPEHSGLVQEDDYSRSLYKILIRKIFEGNYQEIPYRTAKECEESMLVIMVHRIGENSFSIQMNRFYQDVSKKELFLVDKK